MYDFFQNLRDTRWRLVLSLCAMLWYALPVRAEDAGGDSFGRKGTFYFGIMNPYPATFGAGLTHYYKEHWGIAVEFGKGVLVTVAAGLRFRPSSGKLSPIVGLTLSKGGATADSPKGFLYFNTGFDWKWDDGLFLHLGINWAMTPKSDKAEFKPYLQFGFSY